MVDSSTPPDIREIRGHQRLHYKLSENVRKILEVIRGQVTSHQGTLEMFRIHQRSETELLHGIQKTKECDLEAVSCNVPGIKKSLLQTSVICSD